jgi:hypothetical protein
VVEILVTTTCGNMAHPLDSVIGARRPLGIGITPSEFRATYVRKPSDDVLAKYSANPRNSVGDWYEDYVDRIVDQCCARLGLVKLPKGQRKLVGSRVYQTDKIVDVVLRRSENAKPDRTTLGLELKFLGGTGSLVAPKSFVDAVDFTSRPFHCLYVIDGEGWLEGGKIQSVDYLVHWWEFTSSAYLERTLRAYFGDDH